jgi:hypothetical protein
MPDAAKKSPAEAGALLQGLLTINTSRRPARRTCSSGGPRPTERRAACKAVAFPASAASPLLLREPIKSRFDLPRRPARPIRCLNGRQRCTHFRRFVQPVVLCRWTSALPVMYSLTLRAGDPPFPKLAPEGHYSKEIAPNLVISPLSPPKLAALGAIYWCGGVRSCATVACR